MEHCAIFHENFFICSSLPHLNIQVLYSYLIGIQVAGPSISSGQPGPLNALAGSSAADGSGNGGFSAALANLIKVTQFKNTAQLTRVQPNQPSRSERLRRQEESKIVMSTENLEAVERSSGGNNEESKN